MISFASAKETDCIITHAHILEARQSHGSDANMASSVHSLSARWLSKFVSSGHRRACFRLIVERQSSGSSAFLSGSQLHRLAGGVSLWGSRGDAVTLRGLTGKIALARRAKLLTFRMTGPVIPLPVSFKIAMQIMH